MITVDGIEKIIERIESDARRELAEIRDLAEEQIGRIHKEFEEQSRSEFEESCARGRRAAEERYERLCSAAERDARVELMSAKHEIVDSAYQTALERLCNLPEEIYLSLLLRFAKQAVETGEGELILSPRDRKLIGEKVLSAINREMGSKLTLSEQTRPIRGGFILSYGDVEVNCSLEELIRDIRSESEGEVSRILFE